MAKKVTEIRPDDPPVARWAEFVRRHECSRSTKPTWKDELRYMLASEDCYVQCWEFDSERPGHTPYFTWVLVKWRDGDTIRNHDSALANESFGWTPIIFCPWCGVRLSYRRDMKAPAP